MTFRAYTFTLANRSTGQLLGLGLVCPEVRYASVLAVDADRFDRRQAFPSHWKELDADLARGLPSAALDRTSSIVRLLVDADCRSQVVVRALTGMPADGDAERSAQLLDAILKGLAVRSSLGM